MSFTRRIDARAFALQEVRTMKARHGFHLVLAAALAVPTVALADRDDRKERIERSERQAEAPERLQSTLQVDDRIELELNTGCTYRATVRGSVRPVGRVANRDDGQQMLRPNLRIASGVFCPGSVSSRMVEQSVRSTAISRDELERTLELRGTVMREADSRCMYKPDFEVRNDGIVGRSVAYLCPSRSESRGGGPSSRERDYDRDDNWRYDRDDDRDRD
jgi:hypothetical protein